MIDPRAPDYTDTPASPRRARFDYAPRAPDTAPAVSVVTPFHRPGERFLETACSVMRQSLQQWEWLIVNDASDDPASLAVLARFRDADPRIRVIDHDLNRGLPAARNTGFAAARSDLVYLLDDDDLIEPTTLEKTAWLLASRPEVGFANGLSVWFGAREHLWSTGFQEGRGFLDDNHVSGRALVRRRVWDAAGGYDESLREGLEDWDFWLRCAAAGEWGHTLPEYLDWYRRREDPGDRWANLKGAGPRRAFREGLRRRYPDLYGGRFPEVERRRPQTCEAVPEDLPFENALAKERPRLLVLAPWLTLGGADKFNLDVTEQLTRRGWEVTIATTLAGESAWAPAFERATPDVFALANFLEPADRPRFLLYLIASRQPDAVLVTHSELGYRLLPYLRAHGPEPAYLDFCHVEEPGWMDGGYPRHSVRMQEGLDLQLASSRDLADRMVARGADPDRVEVLHTNVDADRWRRDTAARRELRTAWGAGEDETVVLFAGRLCPQKRPAVLARTLLELSRRAAPVRAVIAGDGEDRGWLEEFVRSEDLGERVRLLGPLPNDGIRRAMSASDVFFLPSAWEGIATSLFEAMAMELVVVASDVGGQRELVTPACGLLLPVGDEAEEVGRYADAIEALARDPEERRRRGAAARERIRSGFRLDTMADRLEALLARAGEPGRRRPRAPVEPEVARTWATQALEYLRVSGPAARRSAGVPGGERTDENDALARLAAENRLFRIEQSRAWRAVQRVKRNPVVRGLARLRFGAGWDVEDPDEDPRRRLARLQATASYRSIQALKRTPVYRWYAHRRYGPDWPTPSG